MTKNALELLRAQREQVVSRHVDGENSGNLDEVIASFHRPRYEVLPMGAAFEGEESVRDLVAGLLSAFPDFHFERVATHYADDAVILEGRITGTHRAEWGGIPAKGNSLDVPVACIFDFEDDRLINEKVFFDFASVQRQLTA